jgi:transcriptional antiterminator Rof (Rho-off)
VVYDTRRNNAFARKWQAALCEGYDNLEMELLYRLRAAS